MNAAVNFNGQTTGRTIEVQNDAAEGVLPAKLEPAGTAA